MRDSIIDPLVGTVALNFMHARAGVADEVAHNNCLFLPGWGLRVNVPTADDQCMVSYAIPLPVGAKITDIKTYWASETAGTISTYTSFEKHRMGSGVIEGTDVTFGISGGPSDIAVAARALAEIDVYDGTGYTLNGDESVIIRVLLKGNESFHGIKIKYR